jgi:hypothetical protein
MVLVVRPTFSSPLCVPLAAHEAGSTLQLRHACAKEATRREDRNMQVWPRVVGDLCSCSKLLERACCCQLTCFAVLACLAAISRDGNLAFAGQAHTAADASNLLTNFLTLICFSFFSECILFRVVSHVVLLANCGPPTVRLASSVQAPCFKPIMQTHDFFLPIYCIQRK